jgi:signal peptidase I
MNAAMVGGGLALSVTLVVLLWLRRRLVVVRVEGPSMQPTFRPGEWVLVRRVDPTGIRHGDVVVVERPDQPGRQQPVTSTGRIRRRSWMVKRVLAVSGEPVPASVAAGLGISATSLVPPGHLALIGDNLSASYDSRALGFFPTERTLGIVVRRLEG